MSVVKDFRDFIARGSVVDLAVGVIIGASFSAIVNSMVKDVLMPPIGFLTGHVDFSGLFLPLDGQHYASPDAAKAANAPAIYYGSFLNSVIAFIIQAFVVFLVVKEVNKILPKSPTKTKACPRCTTAIALAATKCPACTIDLPNA